MELKQLSFFGRRLRLPARDVDFGFPAPFACALQLQSRFLLDEAHERPALDVLNGLGQDVIPMRGQHELEDMSVELFQKKAASVLCREAQAFLNQPGAWLWAGFCNADWFWDGCEAPSAVKDSFSSSLSETIQSHMLCLS